MLLRIRLYLVSFYIVALQLTAPSVVLAQDDDEFSAESIEWFEREVRPVLAARCSSCHSQAVGTSKAGLSLDDRASILAGGESGPAIVPGKPDESLLVEAIRRESFEMPPEKALAAAERLTLEEWVRRGAPWPTQVPQPSNGQNWKADRLEQHWAWAQVAPPSIPSTAYDEWSLNPIDRFIFDKLSEQQMLPASDCDSGTLLRRLSFDLTGLPPHVHLGSEQTDPPSSYDQRVDQWINSPQFGVRWGRHWLDLVRYAETLGHEFDFPLRHAWRYRDAMVDTFNADVPYDRMIIEHLAGDQLNAPRRNPLTQVNQSLALTGFWWLGDSVHAPVDIKNDWTTRVDNQIDVVSKTFMGMTVACARCHDHKFDAIGLEDYYGLAGVIKSSRREYALTDPMGKVAEHTLAMHARSTRADRTAMEAFASMSRRVPQQRLEWASQWFDEYVKRLRSLPPEKLEEELPPTSPLWAFRAFLDKDSELLMKLQRQASHADAAYRKWLEESEPFAEFENGVPQGWQLRTLVPKNSPPDFDWFLGRFPLPSRPDVFSSHRFGKKQHVTLRSPDFEMTHNLVCLKMKGKSAQSSVIVSNYFMNEFHNLLFNDTRKPINQLSDGGWVIHHGDLNKYIGHPTFLSIEDEANGWFEIEEVRFANRPPPPQPAAITLAMLKGGDQTAEMLREALVTRIAQSFAIKIASNRELLRSVLEASSRFDLVLPEALAELADFAEPLQAQDQALPDPTILLATSEGSPVDVSIEVRGNPHQLGSIIPRGCFQSLVAHTPARKGSSGRIELARALVDPRHPLTARVVVNRVWQHLLGRGLVSSPDNLGVLGGRPTHPELLDYLAAELIRHDWSLKWLIREIVTSRTYRLSSTPTADHRQRDADGALWSHRPVRRLSAEELRDTMLATVDSLDLRLAGPSVAIHLNDQMTGRGRPQKSGMLDGENRRTLYVEVRRNFLNPFLLAFDFPMPSTTTGQRTQSNVPAQALGLMNDPLVAELARRWVQRKANMTDAKLRIQTMIRHAYHRPPSAKELERCVEFIEAGGNASWEDLAHALLNSKEFSYLR